MKQRTKAIVQYTSIPMIRQETMLKLVRTMKRENIITFDRMVQEFINSWDGMEEARKDADDPQSVIGGYLDNPELLQQHEYAENFEAYKRMHPKAYLDALLWRRLGEKGLRFAGKNSPEAQAVIAEVIEKVKVETGF